ncbi:Shugoshin, C-terminal [Phaffia rhodozyma]|uniref:Shugoshin, C-terminal n=1 Tax=Phaffia rhodozyma TaxID=264483 RepID=A0A0F7SF18_PHARH|nr:Shugoshin, C-terminal [Phaffia rhodozyma]
MPSPSKVGAKKPRYLIEVERLRERLHGITLKHNDVVINNVAHRQKIKELENEVYDLRDEVIRLSERNIRLEAEVGRLRKVEFKSKQDRNGSLQNFLNKEEDAKILLHVLSTLIVSAPALTVLRDEILSNVAPSPPSSTSPLLNRSALPTPLSPHQPFAYWQPKLNPQGTVKASASPVGIDNTLKEEDEPSEDFAQPGSLYMALNQQTVEPPSSSTSLSSIASSSSSRSLSQEAYQPLNPPPTQSAVLARSQSRSSRAARRSSGFLLPPGPNPTQQRTESGLPSNSTSQSAFQSSSGGSEARSTAELSAHKSKGLEKGDVLGEWETVEVKQEPLDEARFLNALNGEMIKKTVRVGDVELFDEISPEDEDKKTVETTIGRAVVPSIPMELTQRPTLTKPVALAIRKGMSSGSLENCSSVSKMIKPPSTATKSLVLPLIASNVPSIAGSSSAPVLPSNSTTISRSSVSKSKTSLVGSMKPPNPKTGFSLISHSTSASSSSSTISAAHTVVAEEGPIKLNGIYNTSQAESKGGSSMVKMKDVADQLRKGIVGPIDRNSPPEKSKLKGKSKAEEEEFVAGVDMDDIGVGYRDDEDQEGEEDRRRMRRRASPATYISEFRQDTTLSRPTLYTPPPEDAPSGTTISSVPSRSASWSTTSKSTEEIQGRRGRERKSVNYKEPSLTTKMRKPADDTTSKPKSRNILPSSSRASSQEVEHDLLSSMDAKNPALVVPRNDLVRRKSSLPKKPPIDNTMTIGRTGSGSHAKMSFSEEEEEEEPEDEDEDEDDYEEIDDREPKAYEEMRPEARRDTGRYSSTSVDTQEVGGDSYDEEDDDHDGAIRRLKIITPAPRASTSSSSSTATRRRDSGLTAGSKKGRIRVPSGDEDDVNFPLDSSRVSIL